MKKLVVLDCECLPNYFLLAVKSHDKRKMLQMEIYGEDARFTTEQRKRIRTLLIRHTTFGFNSIKYDMPMLHLALEGKSCSELYRYSKRIIEGNMPEWMSYREFGMQPNSQIDHTEKAGTVGF